MKGCRQGYFPFFISICIAVVLISFGLPGTASPVLASPVVMDFENIQFEGDAVSIQDLSGDVVYEGMHAGDIKCNSQNCVGKAYLTNLHLSSQLTDIVIEYKVRSVVWRNQEGIVVVAGTGTFTSAGQKEKFSYTTIFQNNQDGTVSAVYNASIPQASFSVPQTTGTFVYGRGP